jgi:Tol biopolymer transport system component
MRGLEEDAKPQRLTNDSAIAMQPQLSSDGKRLVFASNRGTKVFHIWLLDRDTGSVQQLTSGQGELAPALSPDGKFVVYKSIDGPGLWRISTSGGAAEKFTSAHYSDAVFSPDGQTLAFAFSDEKAGRKPRFGIMPATGGEPTRIFDFAVPGAGSLLQFTPDGSALTYAADQAGVAQVWSQPLDGGSPKQLTEFHSEGIFAFAWTKDGKQLVLSRGVVNSDAVLMEETK